MATEAAAKKLKFSPRQRDILLAFARALLPPDVGLPLALDEKNTIGPMEFFLASFGKAGLKGIGFILLFFNLAALIFYPKLKTFLKLSPQDREKYVEGWENSRIKYRRMMLLLLKAFTCMVIFSGHEAQVRVGYDPECLVEAPE